MTAIHTWTDNDVLYSADLNKTFAEAEAIGNVNNFSTFSGTEHLNINWYSGALSTVPSVQYTSSANTDGTSSLAFGRVTGTLTPTTYLFNTALTVTSCVAINNYSIYSVYDECLGSSVDTTKWTSATSGGTITESGGYITLATSCPSGSTTTKTATLTSVGSGSNNLDSYEQIVFYVSETVNAYNQSSSSCTLKFTDGTHNVSLPSISVAPGITTSASATWIGLIEAFHDKVNHRLVIYVNGNYYASSDSSSLSNWYLYMYAYSNTGGATGTTASASFSIAFLGYKSTSFSVGSTITESVTADGTTWETLASPGHIFTNTGHYLGYKIAITKSANDLILFKNPLKLMRTG